MIRTALSLALFLAAASAQQAGNQKDNSHPPLTTSTCTSSGCTPQDQSVVLDSNWAWTHTVGGYTNCFTGNAWDTSICPDPETCAEKCALDLGDYESTYGVSTSGNAITLKFVTTEPNGQAANVGSRTYLLADDSHYQMFKLLNKEFTFDVDVSQLPCGLNGALYFVDIDEDGGMSKYPTNKAGAKYGTGYGDAQCPQDMKFINGMANVDGWQPDGPSEGTGKMGSCATEMDIWESNSMAWAVTPHPCSSEVATNGQTMCNTPETCGTGSQRYSPTGYCDKDGGDFNPYRNGDKTFFGPDSSNTIDTTQKVTVVTQFITSDGTDTGDLVEIRRIFVQNGKVIPTPSTKLGSQSFNSVSDAYVSAEKAAFGDPNSFADHGGMKSVGESMKNGMVLVMSLWADDSAHMLWLDSAYPATKPPSAPGVTRGPCANTTGVPANIIKNDPNAAVTYSNIRFGPHNTTYTPSGPPTPSGCPGGSLQACIGLCPSSPPAAYKDCVQSCVSRCPSTKSFLRREE